MKEQVQKISDRAETYLSDTLDLFEPLAWTERQQSETLRKAFIELGLFEYVGRLAGESVPEVRAHLVERTNDPRYAELFDRYPTLFRSYGLPAVSLRQTGDLEQRTENAVDRVLRGDTVWGVERQPNSLLDLLLEAELWGYHDHGYDIEEIVSHSAVAYPPDPVEATFSDYYALTHSVFAPTNFGWGGDRLLAPPLPYELETTITAGVIRGIAAGHSDIVVELLWIGAIQEQLHPTVFEHAVRWLVDERSVPGRVLQPDMDMTESDREGFAVPMDDTEASTWTGDQLTWLRHYHVNIVTGCMSRYLLDRVDLGEYDTTTVDTDPESFAALASYGSLLNALHDYDLGAAAEQAVAIDEQWFQRFDSLTERVLKFFRAQERGDRFGYWPDEQRLFELEHGDAAAFQSELVEPIASKCQQAITHLEDSLERADHA
ncbi:hypothetical protein [Halobaculum sp. MBLA0143]|uniref:DUF6895 family protein n=1 Tax=Halobaculum sp. MBLA0143 TaxID=3079933 RepID=UPI0035269655